MEEKKGASTREKCGSQPSRGQERASVVAFRRYVPESPREELCRGPTERGDFSL